MYATGDDFVARYDVRLIGDLVSDTGSQVPAGSVPANSNLLAALTDASSAVDAAVFVGNRYTPAQMASLSDTAAAFVRRLACDLTLIYLKRRRGRFDADKDAALLKEVNATLDSLRKGDDLLLVDNQTEAPASTIELVRPELVPVARPCTIRNSTRNYYPIRHDGRTDPDSCR
jgi:phage gp36-like protein